LAIYDIGRFKADLAMKIHNDHKKIFMFCMNFIALVHDLFQNAGHAAQSSCIAQQIKSPRQPSKPEKQV